MIRNLLSVAFAALPSVLMGQSLPAAQRGCPPPPTGQVAAIPDGAPPLAGAVTEIQFIAPHQGWEMGRISWVAADTSGLIYLLQRGDKADPIVVVNREGRVVRSWGKGLFTVPHSIRIDPRGSVWTTDANTSLVRKFSPDGNLLLTIEVGEVPGACDWPTRGVTDIAFAPNGNLYVADGYTNARVVEYSPEGKRLREWGTRGSGPGEFILPHSIAVDESGSVYVADRENGRVQRFRPDGTWRDEWRVGGKPFTIVLGAGSMFLDVATLDSTNRQRPTLVRVSAKDLATTGRMIAPGGHGTAHLPGSSQLLIPSGTKLYVLTLAP